MDLPVRPLVVWVAIPTHQPPPGGVMVSTGSQTVKQASKGWSPSTDQKPSCQQQQLLQQRIGLPGCGVVEVLGPFRAPGIRMGSSRPHLGVNQTRSNLTDEQPVRKRRQAGSSDGIQRIRHRPPGRRKSTYLVTSARLWTRVRFPPPPPFLARVGA